MLKIHKIAISRIFTDLIHADRIIDSGEMECWQNLCRKYDINKSVRVEAGNMSLADAITSIRHSGIRGLQEELLEDCRELIISDGFCAKTEALLMMAFSLTLENPQTSGLEIISIPRANFNIDIATALYIEDEYDPVVNARLRDEYRLIYKEFQLAGFHFVYIPKIIEHYRQTDPSLFKDILSFLAPSISREGLENTYRALMDMSTGGFCKDLLCNKCGITQLRSTPPSLLIKIGNSFVGEDRYSNYLKINVDQSISSIVRSLIDRFTEFLTNDVVVVNTSEERDTQFHFHGFYKQLLDIFLVRRNIRSAVVIDPYKEEIFFPDIDSRASGIHRRERALYTLLLCQGKEGLNFNTPKSAAELKDYNKRMEQIQRRYSAIYELFGGEREGAPDLSVPEIRRPIFSCLKRSIRNLPGLYNPEDYNITKSQDGTFSINIEPDLIRVNQLGSSATLSLAGSELYRRWKNP